MAILLQLREGNRDVDPFFLERSWILLLLRSERDGHGAMVKHAAEPSTLVRELPVLHEAFYEKMEGCIICG